MKLNRIQSACLLAATMAMAHHAYGYEKAYERTPAGEIEVKTLPAALAIAASSARPYFERSNGVFMKLFRYIDAGSIAMTTPVEVDVHASRMRFFVGRQDTDKATRETAEVQPVHLPARTVVALGQRGGYTEERFEAGVTRLRAWLAENPEWVAGGEPVAVYWDAPFVPSWFKRSEIHVPIQRRPDPQ
jgi:hypothetical protein